MKKNIVYRLNFRECVIIAILSPIVGICFILLEINLHKVYTNVADVPQREYALVLGTGKFLPNGNLNNYYKYRIKSSAELYHAKKVKKLIVSGDNSRKDYNEPQMMKDDLIALGVPAENIILDYAGFRTLDSVHRCKNVFKCNSPIIVTQYYHAKRALYLCDKNDMPDAIAYDAKLNGRFRYKLRNNAREFLAWIKAWIDVNVSNKKAKFEK